MMAEKPPTLLSSPVLGEATQLGFVVRDLEVAMRHWIETFGVGPFICMERGVSQPPSTTWHRGEPVCVELKLGFAHMGGVQIELIEQTNNASSPYTEFLASGREGLQHLGFLVDDLAATKQRVEAAGYRPTYEIRVTDDMPITYYDTPALYGPMLELVPARWRPSRQAIWDAVSNWKGGDPVMRFDTYSDFLERAGVRFD